MIIDKAEVQELNEVYRRYTDPKVVSLRYTDPKVVFEAKKG